MLPQPSANKKEYDAMLKRRFEISPEAKTNFHKWKLAKENGFKEYLDFYPIKADYEVSTHCNFRCTMCPLSINEKERKKNMTFEDFKKSIDRQRGLVEIKLQGVGEPLLNTEFFDIANYAVSKNIWVRTITNASMLNVNDNYKKLIDSNIGEIQISFDGATKDTFERIRVGSNFQLIVDNIRLIMDYAHSKGKVWKCSCWMLVQKDNEHEIEEVLKLLSELGVTRLTYAIGVSDWGREDMAAVNEAKEAAIDDDYGMYLVNKGKELGVDVTFWNNYSKFDYLEGKKNICNWPFDRLYIAADMSMCSCCEISDSEILYMGDERDFDNEWNSERYRKFRTNHLNGKLPEICKSCYLR